MTKPGTRNIPEPITVPMIRSIKSGKRSTRRNFVLVAAKLAEFDTFVNGGFDISSTVKVSQAHLCRRNRWTCQMKSNT
jgi:hypothetical protein